MPPARKTIDPEILIEARRLYERTSVPVEDIAAMMGVCRKTLTNRVAKWKWQSRKDRVPRAGPEPAGADDEAALVATSEREDEIAEAPPPVAEDTVPLAKLIMSAAERQMRAIERIVAGLNPAPEHAAEAERASRALASLARTVVEVRALLGAMGQGSGADDGGFPQSLDDLRQELAARIERLAAGVEGAVLREHQDEG